MARLLHKKQTRHGFHGTRLYRIWSSMISRCENKTKGNFKHYGGRGIKVCEEWRLSPKSFFEWALDNNYSDSKEIDRIDVDDHYKPSNCQFLTHKENCAPGKRRIYKNNKTGVRGISISKTGSYEVYITKNGKQKYIGCRKTIKEAIKLKQENL